LFVEVSMSTNERSDTAVPALGVRGKLGLGFAALLAILIFLGAESISLLSDLGGSIAVILRENYRSVIACERMKETLERMDSAALFALGGEVERGRALASENRPRFEQSLQTQLNNITEPGEKEISERLRGHWEAYSPALNDYFAGERSTEDRRRIYFGQLLPRFQQIKSSADEILLLNERSMEEANSRAKDLAADAARRMTFLLVLGTALAALSIYLLSRVILRPLGHLTRAARQVETGDLDASVPVTANDELGTLSSTFNSMIGSLRELRRSDQALLLRARKVSQAAVDQLREAVAVFSDQGEVELVNATAASVLGLRPGEPMPARHTPWLPLLVGQNLAGETPHREALRLEQDGRERFYLPRAVPLRDDGRLLGTLLVLEDATERRHHAEATSDLLATASHELRTPLDALRSCLARLEGGGMDTEREEALESAVREAERLARALDNLDSVSRLEERRQQLRLESAAPRELIEAAAGEFRTSYERYGVKLAVGDTPDIPRVLADAARIKLVLGFLLDNALSHTPAGGTVLMRAEPDAERVRFTVADTGRGIPEKHQKRVFERFYQVPGTEDRGRAGLGLSIAKDIVQSHGGEIHLESAEGRGTTVWFTLPAAREAA
jgi:NtrC-family two-component system sensor histidine kinase KinB